MSKGREITAESLTGVLELARLRQQSGLLSVEHAQGNRVEEGEIYFSKGQPIFARVGQLVGQDALNWLLQWHHVLFTFITDVPNPPANILSARNVRDTVTVPTPVPQSTPVRSPQFAGSVITEEVNKRNRASTNEAFQESFYAPGFEWLVPQKRGLEKDVLSLPLTRRQRFIYFLVDGRRTISDLSRCTGKNIQEVELILRELQEQGLVSV